MLFRLVRPVRRSDTRNPQFVLRIPTDLKSRLAGMNVEVPLGSEFVSIKITDKAQAIRFSLRTADPAEAKRRQAIAVAHLEGLFSSLRTDAQTRLTHKQTLALAGEAYRMLVEKHEDDPGPVQLWDLALHMNARALAATPVGSWPLRIETREERRLRALEQRFGIVTDRVLTRHGLFVDDESRAELLFQVGLAFNQATIQLSNNAGGDYSPDPRADRFGGPFKPSDKGPAPSPERASAVSLTKLVEDWWRINKAAGRTPSTYESYGATMKRLVAFLKHDDATRVTTENVIAYRDHRLAEVNPRTKKPISPKTIKDNDLAGLRAVFGQAVKDRLLPTNPAEGVSLPVGKREVNRELKGFTDDEAIAILSRARSYVPGREAPRLASAKQWVPWLCAFTGARVGELLQLRKEDVQQHGEHWFIKITPEAGTVKTKKARTVPLHPQLLDIGFLRFVQSSTGRYLFVQADKNGEVRGAVKTAANKVRDFVRLAVSDPEVQPNHGWRHRFKTLARKVGMDPYVRDVIQGHAGRSVSDDYGDVDLETRAEAVAKLARYQLR